MIAIMTYEFMFRPVTLWVQFGQVLFKQTYRTQVCVYPVLWHLACNKGLLICLVVFGEFLFCFMHISVKNIHFNIELSYTDLNLKH